MKKLLVFTDLDGTLLNHYNYSWKPAIPALSILSEQAFPVVFSTSKTAAEVIKLKQAMNNLEPFICENGAVANIPVNYFSGTGKDQPDDEYIARLFAQPYTEIISILQRLREQHHYCFRGFNDMQTEDLMALTHLDYAQAENARARQASEPFLWKDTKEAFALFRQQLEAEDLIVTSGGRFYHVMGKINKGQTVKWLIQQYMDAEPDTDWISVALGDSDNDRQMLEVVDYPVLISNPATTQPDLSHINHLIQPALPGPSGWNQAITELVEKVF